MSNVLTKYCHPNRRRGAKGLCCVCYNAQLKISNPGYAEKCKKLAKEYAKTEKYKLVKKNAVYKRRYGISLQDVELLKQIQNNKCALCLLNFKSHMGTHVDHDHKSGRVRGILCAQCNSGIMSKVDADITIIDRIKSYKGAA